MTGPTGLLVVDKPEGPTSHDVVGRLRRLFGTRRVGHAGTLDPMATGVLVALIGEATKLATWLLTDDKRYLARVVFGRSTDALDATGATIAEEPAPGWLLEEVASLSSGLAVGAPRIAAAMAEETSRRSQIPPAFSAIQQGGVRAHARARAGTPLDLPARDVVVRSLRVVGAGRADEGPDAGSPFVDLAIDVGKGYYVRSLARDLGASLGVPALIARLRRTSSGPFSIEDAVSLARLAEESPAERSARLMGLPDAARRALPCVSLSDEGARRARLGQRLAREHLDADVELPAGPCAWLDTSGALVGIGEPEGDGFIVVRNMSTAAP